MYSILKHTHLTLILIAVVLFVARFYWMKTGHVNDQKVIFKKIALHTNLTIFVLGLALLGYLQINPFASANYWALEKMLGLVAFMVMMHTALNKKKIKSIQYLGFVGSFGWLVYLGQLAMTKQAILLAG
ncbi:MAG: SirB2 family protein [Psychromonas sp.]